MSLYIIYKHEFYCDFPIEKEVSERIIKIISPVSL